MGPNPIQQGIAQASQQPQPLRPPPSPMQGLMTPPPMPQGMSLAEYQLFLDSLQKKK